MKLQHLHETPADDRLLISISTALSSHLLTHGPYDSGHSIGTIGDIVGSHISGSLSTVRVVMYDDAELQELLATDPDVGYEGGHYQAMWDADDNTIGLSLDLLSRPNVLRVSITHELRHALDDVKSDMRAGVSSSYNGVNAGNDVDSYVTEPAEVNARYAEAMHLLTPVIKKAFLANPKTAKNASIQALSSIFDSRQITAAFPTGVANPQYKRLLGRSVAYIDRELERLKRLYDR